ncbi:MAG: VCBS repeat-containing protein [Planctomycetes bacterium]|nr:VCBS repeat-containing protein [Planctomycetota bacterium]
MPTHRGGALRSTATARSFVVLIVLASGSALAAQTLHPFGPPRSNATFSLGAVVGTLDVNRDAAPDLMVPGVFFGTMATTLDEHGRALATNVPGPSLQAVPGSPTTPTALAMAAGRIDGDDQEDLLTFTSDGTLHLHRNLGATRPNATAFAADVLVDNVLAQFPINPPFVTYSVPAAQVVDLDHDGHQDLVLAGGPVDRWSASTRPGFVAFYRGDGLGGFTVSRLGIGGCVLDGEIVDLDHDGSVDRLVVLTETGAVGAFSYEILHFAVANGVLVPIGAPQNVGPGRLCAMELADVTGDGELDYLLAQTGASAGTTYAQVYWFEGNAQGHVSSTTWGTWFLPPNVSGLGEFVPSIQAGDWNRDGHVDVAFLRGFVQAPPPQSSTPTQYADSELLVAMGPAVTTAPIETIALPGFVLFTPVATQLFALLPMVATPDALRPIDLGGDRSLDFVLVGLRTTTTPSSMLSVTLRNTTPAQSGDARFEKCGEPSGGVAAFPARIGFDGGPPCPGNASFACTLQNVQGGCLVGLVWGQVGIPDLFVDHGISAHLFPVLYGYARLAGGGGPGAGFWSEPLPIPANPAVVGDAGWFQYVYYDHVSGTFGGTQATGLSIGL